MGPLKTNIEIPETILHRAKSAAVERRISFREFVRRAIEDKLPKDQPTRGKPWMAGFGKLRHLRKETAKINRWIEEEFEQIEGPNR